MRTGLGVLPRFCGLSTVSLLVVIRAAPVALISFALLLPANAQYWGDSWSGRQQQRQQQYNPFGSFWGDRSGGFWGQREAPRYPRQRERAREPEREQPPDYSRAPPATPRKDATVKIVIMGDANADWLAYGLEDAYSEKPEIGIVRKHRTDSGLISYDARRDTEWPQVAREIIATEKPKFIVMMIGNNDRQTIREKVPPPPPSGAPKANAPAPLAPAPADATVIRTLTKGEPIVAPTGRADDFTWPRGMGNVEPDAVERAAPDTAVPDAGTKSDKPVQRTSAMDAYAAQTGREQKPSQRRPRR
jgi:hypothetical protein